MLEIIETDVMLKVIDDNEEDYKAQKEQELWERIYGARQNRSILKGKLTGFETINGVMCGVVSVAGIDRVKGLIPMEHLGYDDPRLFKDLANQEVIFKVTGLDRDGEVFTASRIAAIEHLSGITWDKLEEGQIVEATIRIVKMKWMRLDIGAIEVVLRASEISYEWIDDLRGKYKAGDKIAVKVIKLDKAEKILEVSHKALTPNPWPDCTRRFREGGEYSGKVTGVVEYGVFVNLEPGVEMFTPVPNQDIGRVRKGNEVMVRISEIDVTEQKIKGRITRKF